MASCVHQQSQIPVLRLLQVQLVALQPADFLPCFRVNSKLTAAPSITYDQLSADSYRVHECASLLRRDPQRPRERQCSDLEDVPCIDND